MNPHGVHNEVCYVAMNQTLLEDPVAFAEVLGFGDIDGTPLRLCGLRLMEDVTTIDNVFRHVSVHWSLTFHQAPTIYK